MINDNKDFKFKTRRQEVIAQIATGILLVFSIPFMFIYVGIPMISSVQVAYLARDTKNIEDNGCLLFAGKVTKSGDSMFYLNQHGPYTLRQLSIQPDMNMKLRKLVDKSGVSFNEFAKIHTTECIKVRYIRSKTLWVSSDDLYDFQ